MTEQDIRTLLSEAMQYASVPDFRGSAAQAAFLSGEGDVLFADFDIDSLAAMELCIAIETETGVSVTPAELAQFGSLVAVARHVQEAGGA